MSLASTPEALVCAECGEAFAEGYLPADEAEEGYEPRAEAAVCAACGFNEVGYAGCAPEADDLVDGEGVLLHVSVDGEDLEVVTVKD